MGVVLGIAFQDVHQKLHSLERAYRPPPWFRVYTGFGLYFFVYFPPRLLRQYAIENCAS
jgi:hypothetical protein